MKIAADEDKKKRKCRFNSTLEIDSALHPLWRTLLFWLF